MRALRDKRMPRANRHFLSAASSIDPTRDYFDSKFEIKTTVHKQAEWRKSRGGAVSPESLK
jgi:hypothetical protein